MDSQGRNAKVWIKTGDDVVVSNGPRELKQIENKKWLAASTMKQKVVAILLEPEFNRCLVTTMLPQIHIMSTMIKKTYTMDDFYAFFGDGCTPKLDVFKDKESLLLKIGNVLECGMLDSVTQRDKTLTVTYSDDEVQTRSMKLIILLVSF